MDVKGLDNVTKHWEQQTQMSPEEGASEPQRPTERRLRLGETLKLVCTVPKRTGRKGEREQRLLFRHLVLLAFVLPGMMCLFGAPAVRFLNHKVLLLGALYCLLFLWWAIAGSRYVVYAALVALGATCVSLLSLWSALTVWAADVVEAGPSTALLALAYLCALGLWSIMGSWQWCRGIPHSTQRLIDQTRGIYDLGTQVAFFRTFDLGQVQHPEPMDPLDRAWMDRWGWALYLTAFLTPIVVALIVTSQLDVFRTKAGESLALYGVSLLVGAGAIAYWERALWLWRWERRRDKPLLVKQLAHRYRRRERD